MVQEVLLKKQKMVFFSWLEKAKSRSFSRGGTNLASRNDPVGILFGGYEMAKEFVAQVSD